MITAIGLGIAAIVALPILVLRWLGRHITRAVWRPDIADSLWGTPSRDEARR